MRQYLQKGTLIRFPGNECYEIFGVIGEGGSGLIYSAGKVVSEDGSYMQESSLRYALKECYPVSRQFQFQRTASGEIVPEAASEAAVDYLHYVSDMQLNEGRMTSEIYDSSAIRMIPIQRIASDVAISFDKGAHFFEIHHAFTVMASMENKGQSIASWYEKDNPYPARVIFRMIQETLFAVREVHQAGYLHLDLQEGNIFVTGQPEDESLTCFLIDFGSARKMLADGLCAPIGNQPIFSSEGYRAPEIVRIMNGEAPDFRLGPEADVYSIGYLLLYLLTGRRYSDRMLADVRQSYDGHYLTRKNIQDMKCPPHAEEMMQRLLSKALEKEPEKRYHTVDEMLKDVSAILNAIQPYHSRIAGLKYDAYILYRSDQPLHKQVALSLQKLLERFRTPGIKRIQRVFLDETELSADAQADKQVMDALKASRYLIVIGQEEAQDTIWQAKEVKFFLRFHKPSEVLAVLAAQVPSDSELPENAVSKVGGTERHFSLAADIRGTSEKEILKKLKKDAFLRLAAPILAVPYDGLVQRYHKYQRRKRILTATVCLSVAAAFSAYALYQSYQIALQETIARRNKAQNLCVQAMDQYNRGDQASALSSALEMSEEKGDITNYVVPEQLYTLNTILDSFESGYRMHYSPRQKVTGDFSQIAFSKKGGPYGYAIDKDGKLIVFSAKEEAVVWTVDTEMIQSAVTDAMDQENDIEFVAALDDHRAIIFIGKQSVVKEVQAYAVVIDADSRIILSEFPLEAPISYKKAVFDSKDSLFAYEASDFNLYVYDVEKGTKVGSIPAETEQGEYAFTDVAISEDDSRIAAGTEKRLILYDIASKNQQTIKSVPVSNIIWTDNSHVACENYQITQDTSTSSDPWSREKRHYTFSIYDMMQPDADNVETAIQSVNTNLTDLALSTDDMGMQVLSKGMADEEKPTLMVWLRSDLYFVNGQTGQAEDFIAFQSDIVSVQSSPENNGDIFVGLSDGSMIQVTTEKTVGKRKAYAVDSELYAFSCTTDQKLILHTEEGIVLCAVSEDEDMVQHAVSDDKWNLNSIEEIQSSSGESYRLVWLNDDSNGASLLIHNGVELYDMASDVCLLHTDCEKGNRIQFAQIVENDKGKYLCLLEVSDKNNDASGKMRILSLENAKETFTYPLDGQESLNAGAGGLSWIEEMVIVPDLYHAVVKNRNGQIYEIDLKTGAVTLLPVVQENCERILSMNLSRDGKKMLLLGEKAGYLQLYEYDLENQQIDPQRIWQSEISANAANAFLVKSIDDTQVVVYDGNTVAYLIETEHMQTQQKIEITNSKNVQLSFFENDQCLLGADSERIWLYSFKKRTIVSSYIISDMKDYGLKLSADRNGHYFALKEAAIYQNLRKDDGMRKNDCHIYFVDDRDQIYPYADVAFGYLLPDENVVYQRNKEGYASHPLYTFSELYQKGIKVLEEGE